MVPLLSFAFFWGLVPYAAFRTGMKILGSVAVSSAFAFACTMVVGFGAERTFKAFSDRLHGRSGKRGP